jgi:hypothetical protein
MYRNMLKVLRQNAHAKVLLPLLSCLTKDRTASVSIIFASSMVVVIPAIGVAVDVSREVQFKTALQSAADNAALAGASVYTTAANQAAAISTATNYMKQAIAALPASTQVADVTVSAASTSNGFTIQVGATRAVATTFLAPVMDSIKIAASATAENPLTNTATVNVGQPSSGSGPLVSSSDAGDHNVIYMYAIPADNSAPKDADLVQIFDNDPSKANSNPKTVSLTALASQNIGFALKNTTGGLHPYGTNGYQGKQGTTHMMYSHLNPPSKIAYPSQTKNCLVETNDVTSSPTSTAAAPSSGSCFSTKPGQYTQNLSLDCNKSAGKIIRYYWNDMGGPSDDHDYNDAAYSVQCPSAPSTQANNSGNGPKGVVLIK